MNILHAIYSMERAQGGPPQVCGHLAQLQARTNDVTIASYTSPEQDTSLIPTNVQSAWIGKCSGAEKLLGFTARKYFHEIISRFDILHLHNTWESVLLAGSNAALKMKVPYVVTPHGMLDPWSMSQRSAKKKLAMLLGRRAMLENANFIHVLNTEEERGIRQLGIQNRCEVIPNGVTLESIDPHLDPTDAYKKFPQLGDRPFILFLSRLHFKKGLDILADAATAFFQSNTDWQLVVAGPDDGAEKSFREKVAHLGIQDRVHLVGPIYGSLKYSLLAACDLFCLPSRQEGFSVAILEAMAASIPVVISTHCHFGRVAEVEAGAVTSLDPQHISEQFYLLAQSAEIRKKMGQKGRTLVEQKYTWSAVAKRLQDLYESI